MLKLATLFDALCTCYIQVMWPMQHFKRRWNCQKGLKNIFFVGLKDKINMMRFCSKAGRHDKGIYLNTFFIIFELGSSDYLLPEQYLIANDSWTCFCGDTSSLYNFFVKILGEIYANMLFVQDSCNYLNSKRLGYDVDREGYILILWTMVIIQNPTNDALKALGPNLR